MYRATILNAPHYHCTVELFILNLYTFSTHYFLATTSLRFLKKTVQHMEHCECLIPTDQLGGEGTSLVIFTAHSFKFKTRKK